VVAAAEVPTWLRAVRLNIAANLIAAAVGGAVVLAFGQHHGWIVPLVLFGLGAVFAILGRHSGVARIKIDHPRIDPENISGGGTVAPVQYARVWVTNTSRRITARVRGWLSVDGTRIDSVPLHWRHEKEPATLQQATITDNPPVSLAPSEARELDVAIRYGDGQLFGASVLSYRAPMLQHHLAFPGARLVGLPPRRPRAPRPRAERGTCHPLGRHDGVDGLAIRLSSWPGPSPGRASRMSTSRST
jgi:hypothetical protein